jgi:hypothetical protein
MEHIISDKGGQKLLFEGYLYVKQKVLTNNVVSWECERRRYTESCRAKLKVDGMQVVGRIHEHTHAPDTAKVEVVKAYQSMKQKAKETQVKILNYFIHVKFY